MTFELIGVTGKAIFEVLKWYFVGASAVFGVLAYIVLDMFGAPHSRKKFPWEFWRSR